MEINQNDSLKSGSLFSYSSVELKLDVSLLKTALSRADENDQEKYVVKPACEHIVITGIAK